MIYWLVAGIACFGIGLIIYARLLGENKNKLKLLPVWERVVALVSYIDSDSYNRPTAKKHIIAGVSVCIGLCLLIGVGVSELPFVTCDYGAHGTVLTAAGLTFGILISVISFWTLWQTKKIENLQGAYIPGFKKLAEDLAVAIKKVNEHFVNNGCSASEGHRLIFITINPYFGVLSFLNDPIEVSFREALRAAAENVSRSQGSTKFSMAILCGSISTIENFNRCFFQSKFPSMANADRVAKILDANKRTFAFLDELNIKAGTQVVFQGEHIPDLQFAIVGNSVFEFFLLEPRTGSITGIAGARKIEDGLVCMRFLKQYEVFKKFNPG